MPGLDPIIGVDTDSKDDTCFVYGHTTPKGVLVITDVKFTSEG